MIVVPCLANPGVPPPPVVAIRSKVYLTASAVNGCPLWNLTPRRRVKRQVFGGRSVHDVASTGTIP